MTLTHEQLLKVLLDAQKAARDSLTGDDGGSCNLDKLMLKNVPGLDAALKETVFQRARLDAEGYYTIMPLYERQGFERTAQVEAMQKVFEAAGLKAFVEYYLD